MQSCDEGVTHAAFCRLMSKGYIYLPLAAFFRGATFVGEAAFGMETVRLRVLTSLPSTEAADPSSESRSDRACSQ